MAKEASEAAGWYSEIGITPAMVAAARRAFVAYDSRFTDADEGAMRVVEAALTAGGISVRLVSEDQDEFIAIKREVME